jgi:2-polyprenyl-3-methyl-5-hydroxy-6-metoxy-1,4-benzoquinol methylase
MSQAIDVLEPRALNTLRWATVQLENRRRRGGAATELGHGPALRPKGHRFQEAILGQFGLTSVDQAASATQRMWIDFALSTVDRGRDAVASMGGPEAFRGKRVLDLGCAYGGFLIAALEAGASAGCGVDIELGYLDLARKLMADYGVDIPLRLDDATAPGLASRIGTYDIILCNDVIEHVKEPEACAQNLRALLSLGGRLFLSIPNANAASFLLKDGHYGVFGLTLLDRADAEQWWRRHFADGTYTVEHYASLQYYVATFSRFEIALRLLDSIPADREGMLGRLAKQFDEFERQLDALPADPGPGSLRNEVVRQGHDRILHFRDCLRRYRASGIDAERAILAHNLWLTYDLDFWRLEGTRVDRP